MKSEKWISEHVWNLMTLKRKKYVVLIIVITLIGFVLGYLAGAYMTLKAVARATSGFLDIELLEQAIWQYENHVGACYPPIF